MAKLSLIAGTTSKLLKIFVQDTSKTNGAGLTGLAFGTSGLTCYYIREGDNATTSVSLQTQTLGTWTTRGFIVVDGTNMPGLYEFGIPNAAIAAGAKSVIIYFQGAANMAPAIAEIELTVVDNQSTTFGLGALTVGTNNDKTGYSLSSSQTFNVTGNITGNLSGSVGSVTGNVGGNVTGSVASVLAGGLIDLTTTTYPEASSVLAATATLKDSLVWLKTLSRNKVTQTSTTETLYANDGSTPVSTSTDSDDGTTFTRGKWS